MNNGEKYLDENIAFFKKSINLNNMKPIYEYEYDTHYKGKENCEYLIKWNKKCVFQLASHWNGKKIHSEPNPGSPVRNNVSSFSPKILSMLLHYEFHPLFHCLSTGSTHNFRASVRCILPWEISCILQCRILCTITNDYFVSCVEEGILLVGHQFQSCVHHHADL